MRYFPTFVSEKIVLDFRENTSNERTYGYQNDAVFFAKFRQKISATVRNKKSFCCLMLCCAVVLLHVTSLVIYFQ